MKTIFLLVLCIALLLILVIAVVLGRNMSVWTAEPGFKVRLLTALTMNKAEIKEGHAWAELRPIYFDGDVVLAQSQLVSAMAALGWVDIRQEANQIDAVVRSPMLGFSDDIKVSLIARSGRIMLLGSARSRVGKADFAANASHLIDFSRFLQDEYGWVLD